MQLIDRIGLVMREMNLNVKEIADRGKIHYITLDKPNRLGYNMCG